MELPAGQKLLFVKKTLNQLKGSYANSDSGKNEGAKTFKIDVRRAENFPMNSYEIAIATAEDVFEQK